MKGGIYLDLERVNQAISEIKRDIETSISTATFNGKRYTNGQKAKEALIRSSRLIMQIHELVKISLQDKLPELEIPFEIHPPLGQTRPELSLTGLIKKKDQDVVVLMSPEEQRSEIITDGPLSGQVDRLGREFTEKAIVIGVRSQLSSVAKNFDTLMERAFAETLNLRLRMPRLVMGEVYMIPLYEYDDAAMENNEVIFKTRQINIERFVKTFLSISGRSVNGEGQSDLYKYEKSALLIVDFRSSPPKLIYTREQLAECGVQLAEIENYTTLSPVNFSQGIVEAYRRRFLV